ncbi:MAG: uroporphyrinogen-III synthase [Alphaproteobacteria bacterium]|nr:uroporphyrinogen-III synthase [Alphaproteobacteria bacterium]
MSKTILVTRSKGDEHELTEALQQLGHFVIHEPLTEIFLNHTIRAEVEQAMREEPDAVLITSKHAAQALALLSDIRDTCILAVGTATMEHAMSLGFSRVYDTGGTLESMLEYIQGGYDDGARFLYVSGEHIRSDLPEILGSFGMSCQRIIAYHALAAESLSDTLIAQLKRGQIDAVTFFSPRNVAIFLDLLKRAGCTPASAALDLFALSEEVANAAQDATWRHIFIARKPTLASLVDSVDNIYAQ